MSTCFCLKRKKSRDHKRHEGSSSGDHQYMYKISSLSIQELLRYSSLDRNRGSTNQLIDQQTNTAVPKALWLAWPQNKKALNIYKFTSSVFPSLQVSFCWSSLVSARRRRWRRELRSWTAQSLMWSSVLLTCSGWLTCWHTTTVFPTWKKAIVQKPERTYIFQERFLKSFAAVLLYNSWVYSVPLPLNNHIWNINYTNVIE